MIQVAALLPLEDGACLRQMVRCAPDPRRQSALGAHAGCLGERRPLPALLICQLSDFAGSGTKVQVFALDDDEQDCVARLVGGGLLPR